MVKHPACAAAIISSGLVPFSFSKRVLNDGVDGPLTASMCQAGVFGESPGTGAIHERDYDDRTGSSLTIVGLAMTIGQKTDSKSMARKWSTRISILKTY